MANSRMRISLTRIAQAALHALFLYKDTNALCVVTDYQRKNWVPYLKKIRGIGLQTIYKARLTILSIY